MESQVRNMLRKGVIEPSSSPWAAPAILVPNKSTDGKPKYRFFVDFRALNKITQFDNYPLSIFEETVPTLHGSRYFSVVDLYSGFWQIKLAEEDKLKTSFTCTQRQLQCFASSLWNVKFAGQFPTSDGRSVKEFGRKRVLYIY